jgi:hypothetical protein
VDQKYCATIRLVHELQQFAWAVATHWGGFMTGGLLWAGVLIYERYYGRNIPSLAFYGVAIVLIVRSFFQAWRDEKRRADRVVGERDALKAKVDRRQEDRDAAAAREAAEERRDADRRIDQVVQQYADLVRHNRTSALHGLLVAGIKNLRSSDEIRLARERVTAQTGLDPLRQYAVDGADLKQFVDTAAFDSISVKNDRELRERFCKN